MRVPFSTMAYGRTGSGAPEARLVNMFVEATPGGPAEDTRLPRPGLVQVGASFGGSPIRGGFQASGVFGGSSFVVCGGTAYRDGVSCGAIAGTDLGRFAASGDQLVCVGGGVAHLFNGTSFAPITDPDLPPVSDVAYFAGRFVFTAAGSDQFYWAEVGDGASVEGLSFATAESLADANVGLVTVGTDLIFFGDSSVEPWEASSDGDTPIIPRPGATISRGCAGRDSVVRLDNSAFFVGENRIVYRMAQPPERVSTHGIETRLRACTAIGDLSAFAVTLEGHAFYVLNIPGQGTFAYDIPSQTWAEWTSFGRTTFRGQCAWAFGGDTFAGDAESGVVWKLTQGVFQDGADPIQYLASAFLALEGGVTRCNNAVVQGARGVGLASGQGQNPLIEMRYSDDQGRTWSRWREASPGAMGEYGRRACWQRLGLIREPGRAFEVRSSDPVLVTLIALLVNVERPNG